MQKHDSIQKPVEMPADTAADPTEGKPKKIAKKHLIGNPWIRRPLKVLGWLFVIILLIPVLLYIPPVQDFVVKTATGIVRDKTGMNVDIEKFRLKFPVDLSLQGVSVIEASGDTMVVAEEALVDVKMLSLLHLDVEINKLKLRQAYYRMLSADSSMLMTIRAGHLDVDSKSSANMKLSEISLNEAVLKDADIRLDMNVWKQKPTPPDTTSTPFIIKVGKLDAENLNFTMSMLPIIDTLRFRTSKLLLDNGLIDLRTNNMTFGSLKASDGDALMLAPSLEYVKAHPAPLPDTTSVSKPTVIKAGSISLQGFDARYAVDGSPAVRGFDTNDIRVSGLNIDIENFFNKAAEIRLPITSMRAMEQCGLAITEGSGTFSMDSLGMALKDFNIKTPFSTIEASVGIPNALMTLQPEAPLNVDVTASIGMHDVNSFMPDLAAYTSAVPSATPLNVRLKAGGSLGDADISQLDIALPGILSLHASGDARNALDIRKMVANLDFEGDLRNPHIVYKFVPVEGFDIPRMTLSGNAKADHENYSADFRLLTSLGDVAAKGSVGMNSERYVAALNVNDLNVGAFMGDTVIGQVTASLSATGAGFNPERHGAHSEIKVDLDKGVFNGHTLRDIMLRATLAGGNFTLDANSDSPLLDFDIVGKGSISPDKYNMHVEADLRNADLKALGFSPEKSDGSAKLTVSGTASPRAWIYNVDLRLDQLAWHLPEQNIIISDGMTVSLVADAANTRCALTARGTAVDFIAPTGLKPLIDGFSAVAALIPEAIEKRSLDVAAIESKLPSFDLSARVDGKGVVSNFLKDTGMSIGDLSMNLRKDSTVKGDILLNTLNTGGMRLDTITFGIKSRGNLLDYRVHLGNRPGNLDEFAKVNMSGYVGSNRLSAFLVQHNAAGKMGYRIGFTASIADSVVSLRFTPLKATIAYLPWQFNLDNYIDLSLTNLNIKANLEASSDESSILLKTQPTESGYDALHLNLKNIHVQDFLKMSLNAPPLTATVNSDLNVRYTGRALVGKGTLDVNDFVFDRKRVGDFSLNFAAGMGNKGKSGGKIGLLVNNREAAVMKFFLVPDSLNGGKGLIAERLNLLLTKFPVDIANPFFPQGTMRLSGALSGDMNVSGKLTAPKLNGNVCGDSLGVFVAMLGTTFKLDDDSITVADNVLRFKDFDIYAVNSNPLTINGEVDASSLSKINFDLFAKAKNMQLTGQKGSRGDVTGKLFVDLDAAVTGNMKMMNINADLDVLPTTDVTYNLAMGADEIAQGRGADGVVRFVNFEDSTLVAKNDTIKSSLGMRITAKAVISQGAQIAVNLGGNGKVECNPSGTLNYFQNYMGDMKLNGTLYTGTGYARYNVPLLGNKNFDFDRASHITWNGDLMNPTLSVKASDNLKTNIQMGGNTRMVNFLVTLNIGNTLSSPSVAFDLSTDDDISISNELQSMTPEQRQQQAISLLLTGAYTGPGAKTVNSNLVTGNLYNFLSSRLNALAARSIKGVDINFGVDQYQTGVNGNTTTNMSYSYQVSKSLINNRFKILVGGNYSTDASADENFQQNLLSDIAFEYILKQTNNMSLNARLFRHTGFESVLEGEITETGIGFSLRRRLAYFTEITHFGLSKLWKKPKKTTVPDSIGAPAQPAALPKDSLQPAVRKEVENEK